MAAKTEAQEEFENLFTASNKGPQTHPEDREDSTGDELDEETEYQNGQIDETMQMPTFDRGVGTKMQYKLPHKSFDHGRSTGVKGVIADARSYEQARRGEAAAGRYPSATGPRKNHGRINSIAAEKKLNRQSFLHSDSEEEEDEDFIEQWRESRKRELMRDGNDIRNRRTSPSVRRYGRFDEVDALGYLDAIEKVGRETVVVVFVYDHESSVSEVIEEALIPLVPTNPAVHFVKVHYEDIEFDNAAVPAILAYKNQGDLFANLTYIIDQIPDDTIFDTSALKNVLQKHKVLP